MFDLDRGRYAPEFIAKNREVRVFCRTEHNALLPFLQHLPDDLSSLDITAPWLSAVPTELARFRNLNALSLSLGPKVDIAVLSELQQLKRLALVHFKKVDWASLGSGIQSLSLYRSGGPKLPVFSERFPHLEKLQVLGTSAESAAFVEGLDLRTLELRYNYKLRDLSAVWRLRNLAVLAITHCKKVDSIEGIEALRELQNLALCDMGTIETLTPLDALPWLRYLDVHGTTTISDGRLAFLQAKGVHITSARREHYDAKFGWSA